MSQNPNPSLLDPGQIVKRAFDGDEDRIRVDATISATLGDVRITDGTKDATLTTVGSQNGLDVNILNDIEISIDQSTDSIKIGDGTNLITSTNVGGKQGLDVNVIAASSTIVDGANTLNVNSDGSIDVNLASIPSGEFLVNDSLARTLLAAIDTKLGQLNNQTDTLESLSSTANSSLSSINTNVEATNTILNTTVSDLLGDIVTNTDDIENILSLTIGNLLTSILAAINALPTNNNGLTLGTENGQTSGTPHVFVNNIRQMILATQDRDQDITYADFGTRNQRIIQIDYSSSTINTAIARKTINYTLVGNKYRRDSINWTVV